MRMKRRFIWILVAMLWMGPGIIQAQVVLDDPEEIIEEDDEDEDDEDDEETDAVALGEDEISVTDSEGNEEVIEFPEAMSYDLDSLMNLYMSKTYLSEDNDCQMKNVNPT